MQIQSNTPLAPMTSFGVGGHAEKLITLTSSREIEQAMAEVGQNRPWLLGHGTNVLISDEGLPGITLRFADGDIRLEGNLLIADAGASWDDAVKLAIENNMWGIEFTSGIPGSVGAAAYINITAYGHSQNDHLSWIEAVDRHSNQLIQLKASELEWGYKQSVFQNDERYIIVRCAYELSAVPTKDLTYQSALDVAKELDVAPDSLANRRRIIMETRKRAGSLFQYSGHYAKTVGSFFRNPLVTPEQAKRVIAADETGKTRQQIAKMNKVHGGDNLRVSAAHCLLAAGFKRGQEWGAVRLHPEHVLKIENAGGATAQEIYDVAETIIDTVQEKLGITLASEAKILGEFNR